MAVTIKEYAMKHGISYVAVYKSCQRYQKELKSHITITNGVRYLDDQACRILDEHRKPSTIIIQNTENTELKEQIDQLKNTVVKLQQDLINSKQEIIDQQKAYQLLQAENVKLLQERSPAEGSEPKPSAGSPEPAEPKRHWWQLWK